jgi:lysine 2,3-aminomutase
MIDAVYPSTWTELVANRIERPARLPAALQGEGASLEKVVAAFPMRVNPYFLSLIRAAGDPLGRQVIPCPDELRDTGGCLDPLAEERQAPAAQVIHRYPARAVFLVSNQCAVHCRFCMRKRRLAGGRQVPQALLDEGLAYIRRQSRVNEVILSGGDPLMLGDERLAALLQALRDIEHVRILRIHTRMPGVLPQRVTADLARRLAAFHPLYINIHFNHPSEITPETVAACRRLADAGIPLGSQTVLLKGINDDPAVLLELMVRLLEIRVRPYYLHQLDRVPGTAHFQVPVARSIRLLEALRGPLSGMGVPHLMLDLPGGGGKVALTPDAIVQRGAKQWRIRNWQGEVFTYPLPD